MMPAVQGGPGMAVAAGAIRRSIAGSGRTAMDAVGFGGEHGVSGSGVSSGDGFGAAMTAALSDASPPGEANGQRSVPAVVEGAEKTTAQDGVNSQAAGTAENAVASSGVAGANATNGNTKQKVGAAGVPQTGGNATPTVAKPGSGGEALPIAETGPVGSAGAGAAKIAWHPAWEAPALGTSALATSSAGGSAMRGALPPMGGDATAVAQSTVTTTVTDAGKAARAGVLAPAGASVGGVGAASGDATGGRGKGVSLVPNNGAPKTDAHTTDTRKTDTRKTDAKKTAGDRRAAVPPMQTPGMAANGLNLPAPVAGLVAGLVAAQVAAARGHVPVAGLAGSGGHARGRTGAKASAARAAATVVPVSGTTPSGGAEKAWVGLNAVGGGAATVASSVGRATPGGGTADGHGASAGGAHSAGAPSGTGQGAAGQNGWGLAASHSQNAATDAAAAGGPASHGFTATLLQGHPGATTGAGAASHPGVQHASGGAGAANPYARMDEPPRATLVYASPQKMSVAVSDPALGNFQIRAQGTGAQIAASLATASAATHAQLSGHLLSLTAFLQDQRVDVTRVTVVPQGLMGGDSGARNFGGQQQQGHSGSSSSSGSQGTRTGTGRLGSVDSVGVVSGARLELGASQAENPAVGLESGTAGAGMDGRAGTSRGARMGYVDLHA